MTKNIKVITKNKWVLVEAHAKDNFTIKKFEQISKDDHVEIDFLPKRICSNCKYWREKKDICGKGNCKHPRILAMLHNYLLFDKDFGCIFWTRKGGEPWRRERICKK